MRVRYYEADGPCLDNPSFQSACDVPKCNKYRESSANTYTDRYLRPGRHASPDLPVRQPRRASFHIDARNSLNELTEFSNLLIPDEHLRRFERYTLA